MSDLLVVGISDYKVAREPKHLLHMHWDLV